MECDVLCRVVRGTGDRHRREDTAGVARGPLEHLHAAHRSADDAEKIGDAQVIEQCCLGAHHVGDGHHRETQVPRLAGGRLARQRAGRAHAVAQHVDANDEVTRRIEDFARPDQALPPAVLAGDGMPLGDELVAAERMADQDRIGLVGVQRAVGLIGHPVGPEIDAAVETQRLLGTQDRMAALGERHLLGVGQVLEQRPLQRKSPRPEGRGLFQALRPFSGD